ncbi:hypothetical protein NMS_1650 [Nonlabens marinus S1-08]|uniref:Uncharacterized protein n=1 Tax=Nonlabens marinus S1-08 TaxID=1454201 RepID=W8VQG7_9FLAO|nr:hypothetical protein NMS_1650 [Nonlabens marinus S1-08]
MMTNKSKSNFFIAMILFDKFAFAKANKFQHTASILMP